MSEYSHDRKAAKIEKNVKFLIEVEGINWKFPLQNIHETGKNNFRFKQ